MVRFTQLTIPLLLSLTLAACASSNLSASTFVFPTGPASAAPPVSAPLYLVLEPAAMPDSLPIRHDGLATHTVDRLRDTLRRAMLQRFAVFFRPITAVTNHAELPTTPHWVARLSVRGLDLNSRLGPDQRRSWQGLATWTITLSHSEDGNAPDSATHNVQQTSVAVANFSGHTAATTLTDAQRTQLVRDVFAVVLTQQSELITRHMPALRGECGMRNYRGNLTGSPCQ